MSNGTFTPIRYWLIQQMCLYSCQTRGYFAAATALRTAININPQDASAHTQLGVALEQLGNTKEAMEHYRQALTHNPNDRDANYLFARHLLSVHQSVEALTRLQNTL